MRTRVNAVGRMIRTRAERRGRKRYLVWLRRERRVLGEMRLTKEDFCRLGSLGCIGVKEGDEVVLCSVLDERTTVADERDAHNDNE